MISNITTKCKLCGKARGNHRAKTLECPSGAKTRIGYTQFGPGVFDPKPATKKEIEAEKTKFTL